MTAPADPAPPKATSSGPFSGLLRRSGSVGSLNSMVSLVDSVTGEQQLRICQHCDQVRECYGGTRQNRLHGGTEVRGTTVQLQGRC